MFTLTLVTILCGFSVDENGASFGFIAGETYLYRCASKLAEIRGQQGMCFLVMELICMMFAAIIGKVLMIDDSQSEVIPLGECATPFSSKHRSHLALVRHVFFNAFSASTHVFWVIWLKV